MEKKLNKNLSIYLEALKATTKKNDLKLQQRKLTQKSIQYEKEKASKELKPSAKLAAEQEIYRRMKQRKDKVAQYIKDYGYLNSGDVVNKSYSGLMQDINNRRSKNFALPVTDLVPKIEYEGIDGQQIPMDSLTTEEKRKLLKEKRNAPVMQTKALMDLVTKSNSADVIKKIEELNQKQDDVNNLQIENQKLNDLLDLLNPEGKQTNIS